MRPYVELRRILEAEHACIYGVGGVAERCAAYLALEDELDDEEREALTVSEMLLAAHQPSVPKSWSRMRLDPSACCVASPLLSARWLTGARLAEVFQVPASSEVFRSALRAALDADLLRFDKAALQTGLDETTVTAGPRTIASMEEGRETWRPIWR